MKTKKLINGFDKCIAVTLYSIIVYILLVLISELF